MTDASRRGIGIGQVAGAVLGVFGLRFSALVSPAGALPSGVRFLAALYFLAALAGGIMLLSRRTMGAWISLLVQAAQVAAVTFPGGAFVFLAGPFFGLRAGGGGFRLELGVGGVAWATLLTGWVPWPPGAYFEFGAGLRPTDPDGMVVALNALAVFATIRLFRHLSVGETGAESVRPVA